MDLFLQDLSSLDRLRIAFSNLENIQPHKIRSPIYQPRRASVAIIIRIRPRNLSHNHDKSVFAESSKSSEGTKKLQENDDSIANLENFWNLPWVTNGEPEIFYIKRALRKGDRWSGQMAFPGGKQDDKDVDDLDTAERETFEEGNVVLYNFFSIENHPIHLTSEIFY